MELVFEPARNGEPSARLGSLRLHSAYDPGEEARRFLDSSLGGKRPALVVLLGPCLDYLSPLLKARFPRAAILSIQYSSGFEGRGAADAAWSPGPGPELGDFLERSLDEDLAVGVTVLEWPAASRAFPAEAEAAARILRGHLERMAASAATLKSFGRRWFANACRSFLLAERLLAPTALDGALVVAAAGPSLEEALEDLLPHRGRFRLLAVSSALAALRARGFEPDLVVATDGGFWSRAHLEPLAERPAALAAPLSALASASLSANPLLPVRQDGFPERELCEALGGGLAIPSHGTVSGTALRLALRLGPGPVIAAGFDFAALGSRSHAGPHGFDHLTRHAASRLGPAEGLAWEREAALSPTLLSEGPWRSSRSLETYAAALSSECESLPDRLFRLRPSPVPLSGFAEIGGKDLPGLLGPARLEPKAFAEASPPPLESRRAVLKALFAHSREASRQALLAFRAGDSPAGGRAAELFRALDLPDWAAALRALASGGDPGPAAQALDAGVRAYLDDLEGRLLS